MQSKDFKDRICFATGTIDIISYVLVFGKVLELSCVCVLSLVHAHDT